MHLPPFLWRLFQIGPQIAYRLGLGSLLGRNILLLTTIGRKTGRRRTVPLTYEEADGSITVASARGAAGDWLRNLEANPQAEVRVGRRRFAARAEVITDPARILGYLERLKARNPAVFRRALQMEGLGAGASREQLLALAARRPMAILRPIDRPV